MIIMTPKNWTFHLQTLMFTINYTIMATKYKPVGEFIDRSFANASSAPINKSRNHSRRSRSCIMRPCPIRMPKTTHISFDVESVKTQPKSKEATFLQLSQITNI